MGGKLSVQTTIQTTVNTTVNSLNNLAAASATANCIISIGSISFTEAENCTLSIINNCSASATAAIDAVTTAATQVYNGLTSEQKETGAQLFTASTNIQTTAQTMVNTFESYVNNTCKTDALINNVITIQNINYGVCKSSIPTEIKFINTGQASANCAINVVNNMLVKAVNNAAAAEISTNSNDMIIFGLISLAAIVAIVILINSLKTLLFMSAKDKIKLELAKKEHPDIFTRYTHNFFDKSTNIKPATKPTPSPFDFKPPSLDMKAVDIGSLVGSSKKPMKK